MPKSSLLATLLLLIASASAAAAPTRLPVTLQLKWYHQFQFAGYYAALEQGYYREAGLDVTIRAGRPDIDPVAEVVSGKADFGIGASELVLMRAQGKPVVALAVILQHSPLVLLARGGPHVSSFQGLVGKEIRIVPHEYELEALMRSKGYSPEDFHLVPRTTHDIDDLLTGRVAAVSAYSTNEPYILDQLGMDYVQISPRSAGIDFYGDTLFTSEKRLQQSPEAVAAFRRASLRGWRYAMEHPRKLAKLIATQYAPAKHLDHLLFEARQMRVLIIPDVVEIGYMNEERWHHIANTYADLGMMKRDVPLAGFIYNPNPQRDLTWFYLSTIAGFAAALLVGTVSLYIHRINRRLRTSVNYHRQLIDSAPFPVVVTRLDDNTVAYINRRAETDFGVKRNEMIGRKANTFWVDVSQRQMMLDQLRDQGSVSDFEAEFIAGDEKRFWGYLSAVITEFNGIPSLLISFNDITERKQAEDRLEQMAHFDMLTGVPNRQLFFERLEQSISLARRHDERLALLFIDLDGFKEINDTLGHEAGDTVLRKIAQRLHHEIRESDTVARVGGDEFVVLINTLHSSDNLEAIVQKLLEAITRPIELKGKEYVIGASIGISLFPEHGPDAAVLLSRADSAMYQSKHAGKNRWTFYAAG